MEIKTLSGNPQDQQTAVEAIKTRANKQDWYVLRYDMATTAYNNELVFKTLGGAQLEFEKTEASYPEERVELVFSPELGDPAFGDNIVVNYKLFQGGSRLTKLEQKKLNMFEHMIDEECSFEGAEKAVQRLLEEGFKREELIEMNFPENMVDEIIADEIIEELEREEYE